MTDRKKHVMDTEYHIYHSHTDERFYVSHYSPNEKEKIGNETNLKSLREILKGLEKEIQIRETMIEEIMLFVDPIILSMFSTPPKDEQLRNKQIKEYRDRFTDYILDIWKTEEELNLIIKQFNELEHKKSRFDFYVDLNRQLPLGKYPLFKEYWDKQKKTHSKN
jgi:hypothetical protein